MGYSIFFLCSCLCVGSPRCACERGEMIIGEWLQDDLCPPPRRETKQSNEMRYHSNQSSYLPLISRVSSYTDRILTLTPTISVQIVLGALNTRLGAALSGKSLRARPPPDNTEPAG